eukprot:4549106-Lingulodinium_polyedra.AAC.1
MLIDRCLANRPTGGAPSTPPRVGRQTANTAFQSSVEKTNARRTSTGSAWMFSRKRITASC